MERELHERIEIDEATRTNGTSCKRICCAIRIHSADPRASDAAAGLGPSCDVMAQGQSQRSDICLKTL